MNYLQHTYLFSFGKNKNSNYFNYFILQIRKVVSAYKLYVSGCSTKKVEIKKFIQYNPSRKVEHVCFYGKIESCLIFPVPNVFMNPRLSCQIGFWQDAWLRGRCVLQIEYSYHTLLTWQSEITEIISLDRFWRNFWFILLQIKFTLKY